ncbi:2-amino-4-hydroxy-6-hydroxymethyldihydropteridine diphosphokinase [Chelatococcus reniformis]|uniref:2-amino-4-hydroxy-6-hydroxymethyldihydropteridine pyrophosphokinase n=1 Tax=Chelatococcus reniformis TaxID=1494448 RepID=A0A916UXX5_9HYPH|nr:2-amino-4-hydroxy-6-hydroxymethyldihydropteridine diphosphokinase [Chelatococcus reniformis]GGC92178.1 2-amino-4-hydroxy-6-hydroxymethyldihydropteridine diphosphokinase [Chelatococcus reniformis]
MVEFKYRRAYLGLGSNLGDSRAMLAAAAEALAAVPGLAVVARSADYRTPPWGDADQPAFANACIAVDTTLTPEQLLDACLAAERALGRDRNAPEARRWGPRLIDIDVLDYEGARRATAALVLPHPRLAERAFVLLPLAEIAPEHIISGGGGERLTVREALARLDANGIEPLT